MNNLQTIISIIDDSMKKFIQQNPLNKNQELCEKYVLNILMQKTEGKINPSLALQIIKLHRSPMEESGFFLQC